VSEDGEQIGHEIEVGGPCAPVGTDRFRRWHGDQRAVRIVGGDGTGDEVLNDGGNIQKQPCPAVVRVVFEGDRDTRMVPLVDRSKCPLHVTGAAVIRRRCG